MRSLVALVEEVEVGSDADSLRDALAGADRLEARIVMALIGFANSGEWEIEGSTSPTAWLREHARMTGAQAAWLVRCARRMAQLPVTADAWFEGALSGGQVRVILANLCDRTVEMFAGHEAELVPHLVALSVRDCVTAMEHWRAKALARLNHQQPVEPENSLWCSTTLGGRGELKGSLEADKRAVVQSALRVATTQDDETQRRSPAERRADALVDICRFFLDHQKSHVAGRHRPHVNVVAQREPDGSWLGMLEDGTPIPHASLERLLCDCTLHKVVTDTVGTILDYGRSLRTAPPALFNALIVRDRGCRFCDRAAVFCEAHHVEHWEDGGPTSIDNMILACWRHHDLIHRQRWRLRLRPDGVLEVEMPDGRAWTNYPPGMLRPPVAA